MQHTITTCCWRINTFRKTLNLIHARLDTVSIWEPWGRNGLKEWNHLPVINGAYSLTAHVQLVGKTSWMEWWISLYSLTCICMYKINEFSPSLDSALLLVTCTALTDNNQRKRFHPVGCFYNWHSFRFYLLSIIILVSRKVYNTVYKYRELYKLENSIEMKFCDSVGRKEL